MMSILTRAPDSAADTMIALASAATGVPAERLRDQDYAPELLWLRRLTAWLMRDIAGLVVVDIANRLGVTPAFVNEACFAARRRISHRGIDVSRPHAVIASDVAALLAPGPSASAPAPSSLSDCLAATALAFELSYHALTGGGRTLRSSRARHCFCWLASIVSTAEPKEIARRVGRGRTAVQHGIRFVDRHPGAASLRQFLVDRIAEGNCLDIPKLVAACQQLEALTRPAAADMERLNP